MKILFLSDDFPPQSFGGAGISTSELAKGVRKAGHEVFVVTTCRKESDAGEYEYQGLKVFRIASDYHERWRGYLSLYNPRVVEKLKKILEEVRPDVVHANNIHHYLSYHSLKVAKKYAKVVITFRDAMAFSFGKLETKKYLKNFDSSITWIDNLKQAKKRWNPLRNILIKWYLGYADKLFAVSNSLKQALERNGIKNVEVMHTGIDLADYPTSSNKQNKKVILFAGRLSEAKGGRVIEEAMKIVLKSEPNAELMTAGRGSKWLNREEMKQAYLDSSIVIVPSIYLDPFPRTVLEAMAMGKPVVGTCYGGAPEIIEDGVTGYVVNPLNIKVMAEKMLDLLKNPQKAEMFGQAGRERIKTHFNLDDKITKLMSVYEELC